MMMESSLLNPVGQAGAGQHQHQGTGQSHGGDRTTLTEIIEFYIRDLSPLTGNNLSPPSAPLWSPFIGNTLVDT